MNLSEKLVLEGLLVILGGSYIDQAKPFVAGMEYIGGCPLGSYEVDVCIAKKMGRPECFGFVDDVDATLSSLQSISDECVLLGQQQLDDKLRN